jgi:branched-subunit amino acid permease
MGAGWKIVWLSAVVFALAFGAGRLFVPDIVPIAFAEEPQPSWAVMTAFVLRAIELIAAWVAIISASILVGAWARDRLRRLFRDGPFKSHPTSRTE